MCDTCGCNREETFHVHTGVAGNHRRYHRHRSVGGHVIVHSHEHSHQHERGNQHTHDNEARTLDVHRSLLAANDRLAERNRGFFRAKKIRAINVLSSPGAGKTTLLERTLSQSPNGISMAVVVGDLATENDAARLRANGAEVVQITTGTLCHLDAGMVGAAIEEMDLPEGGTLFIENVGNLVCPASFDLGESERVVLFSVTEGEDKPLKYPPIFKVADVVVITKTDLAEATGFDWEMALENLSKIAPQAKIIELSARADAGMEEWFEFVKQGTPKGNF